MNTEGLHINKPAGAFDGKDGGLRVTRDCTNVPEGYPFVNNAIYAYTITGKQQKAFEWVGYAELDNYSDFGENVGFYSKGNKFGMGATWGHVAEVCDTEGKPGGAVGEEVDCWVTGVDNGTRLGLNVVVGDARQIRGLPGAGVAEATVGVKINASSGTSWARWMFGMVVEAFKVAGIVLDSVAERAIWLKGKYIVGLDMSEADVRTPIRFRMGQRLTFDQFDSIGVSAHDGYLVFDNCGTTLMKLDYNTGDLYLKGAVHAVGTN
jgi:hypothetical protein